MIDNKVVLLPVIVGLVLVAPKSLYALEPSDAQGDIFQVVGDGRMAHVLRRSGEKVRAEPYLQLYNGDKVIAERGVRILIRGIASKPIVVTSKEAPFLIQASSGSLSASARQWFLRLTDFFTAKPRALVVHNLPRDDSIPQLKKPTFLSEERQFVPIGLERLSIIWRGGAGSATFIDDAGGVTLNPPTNFSRTTFNIPLKLSGRVHFGREYSSEFGWQVILTDQNAIPLPPWSREQPVSNRDRAARAIWILTEGPDEWRLFAVSELELLKEADPFAGRFWHLLGSGQWPLET